MQSFTQQIFQNITRFVPAFTDEFSYKYVLNSLTYDYNTGLATASMSPADIAQLVATNMFSFTITDVKTQINITSATWQPDLSLVVVFGSNVSLTPKTFITLEGFLPVDYNIMWEVQSCSNNTCVLAPYNNTNIVLTRPTITQQGYYANYKPVSLFNGVKTITINQSNNTISYPITQQGYLATSTLVRTLSGGETGVGYIHNWHNNILIGKDEKYYQQFSDQSGKKKNALFVVTNDWLARTNQEKFVNVDTTDRQDSRLGNFTRIIYTFYLDYFINTTESAMKSSIESKATTLWQNLYTFDGLRFTIPNPVNPQKYVQYYYALSGEYQPLRDSSGDLLQIVRYSFSTIVTYSGGYILNDDFFEITDINEMNLNAIIQDNNFSLNF